MIRPRVFQFAVPYRRSAWVLIILDCHFHKVGHRKTLFINNGFVPVLFPSFCDRPRAASIFAMVSSLPPPTPSTSALTSTQRVEAMFRRPRADISTQDMKLEDTSSPVGGLKSSNPFQSFDPILNLCGLPTIPSSPPPSSSSLVIARPSGSQ